MKPHDSAAIAHSFGAGIPGIRVPDFAPCTCANCNPLRPRWPAELPPCRANLNTGDYSLPGLEHWVAIERKTLGDLIKTLLGGHKNLVGDYVAEAERFRAELERMRAMPAGSLRAVVVESDVDHIERELFKVPKGRAVAVERELAANCEQYRGTWAEGAIPCEACPGYRWPGTRCFLCAAPPPGELLYQNVNPVSLLHFCDSLSLDYGVPWIWCSSREGAERWVGGTLLRIWEQTRGKGPAFKKACDRGVAGFRPWLAQHAGEVVG